MVAGPRRLSLPTLYILGCHEVIAATWTLSKVQIGRLASDERPQQGGVMAERVEIATYDKQWPGHFRDIAASLQALIGLEVIAIDHIGSTAVPGLSAKPLIDIDVTLPSPEHVLAAISTMEDAGYENRGNRYERDVYAFLMTSTNPKRRVYLLPQGNETHQKRIIFRDYLIAHPQIMAEYSALKQKLAREYAYDGDGYTRAKADFVNRVVATARSTR